MGLPFLKIQTIFTSGENVQLQYVTKVNVDHAGPLPQDVLPKLFFAKDGLLHKNLSSVLAVVAMVDGQAKHFLITNPKVSAGIKNTLTPHVKDHAQVLNALTLGLTESTLVKILAVGSLLLWLVTLLLLQLIPVDWTSCFTNQDRSCQESTATTILLTML